MQCSHRISGWENDTTTFKYNFWTWGETATLRFCDGCYLQNTRMERVTLNLAFSFYPMQTL